MSLEKNIARNALNEELNGKPKVSNGFSYTR